MTSARFYITEGTRIFYTSWKNRIKKKKYVAGDAKAICKKIVDECWNGRFFQTSTTNFPQFWTRDFGLCTRSLMTMRQQDKIHLGNLNAKRDWGYAKDFVEGMWSMLQQDTPDDFVLATGIQYTVREFVEEAFSLCGINIEWVGTGLEEKGIEKETGRVFIEINPTYFRPTEVDSLLGDASKAKKVLGWQPKTNFKELAALMVDHDLKQVGLSRQEILAGVKP